MRTILSLFIVLFSLSTTATLCNAQLIDAGDVTGQQGKGELAISVDSTDASIAQLVRRAFSLHGGCALTTPADATFVIQVNPAGSNSALLTISSGQPLQKQLSREVSGTDQLNAVLRACDMAVEATMRSKGFFAGKLAFVGKQRGVSELYTSDLLFSRVRPLTADRSLLTGPSWSSDGRRILYTTYYKTGFPDVYMYDISTGRKEPIATFKGTNTGGAFSPDSRRIALTLSGSGNSEIYTANTQGKDLRRLTTNKSLEASPSWSPDGSRLVFTSDAPGKPQLYEISVNGGPMRRIPTNVSSYCSEPAWNPVKQNLIAFTAAVSGGFQIALYDSSKRSSKILTSVDDSAVEPTWMNDGRHLVFTQRTKGRTRLMLLDSETGKVSPLHNPSFGDASSASFVY
ncbi:MAG: biopolymer transporter Tol [Opitutales bacterium]|jgi:TolB protein|nr:biopolymer transporter Tol [Opitutales bacterium]MDP4778514.1 biopolymer transporter Tol [Opitutales bacterium]MDP4883251.1 biopolymer transporter Tol [Opitutales bacterium]MDP5079454.1 biopolymer transporter Tol [Opitutales bacterium]